MIGVADVRNPDEDHLTAQPLPLALTVDIASLTSNIEDAGFDVVNVGNVSEAVRLLERVEPEVVIVSVSNDGSADHAITFIEAARATALRAGTPVVVLADQGHECDVERAYRAGATDVWRRNAGPVILKQRLQFLLSATRAFGELQRSNHRLERAQRLARFATWEWSFATDVVQWSTELQRLLASAGPEQVGFEAILEMVHPADRTRVERHLVEAVKSGTAFCFDHRALRADGSELVLHQEGEVVLDDVGGVAGLEGFTVDVTDLKQAELQIHSLANYDRLTGLPNRLSFMDLVTHTLERAERSAAATAVALLDIDRFKEINESLGHDAGDHLLREVAERLVSCLRKGDFIARENDSMVARRGGDEFLILLDDVEEAHHAAAAAKRILDALSRPFNIADKEVHVSATIGIAVSASADAKADELVRQAEIAMYSGKESGRDTFQFFDEPMHLAVTERFDMETRLRRAVSLDELELYYQPLVNAQTRSFVGVEALVRWHHPVKGLLTADEFVPLAEETGLIVPIGRWVVRTACEQLSTWRKQGRGSMRLSVNLSPCELRAPGFVASIASVLEKTGVRPGELELEITERGVMQNDQATLDLLRHLQAMGIRLAVDDFGRGHTTFHYLKHFPLNTLKIDKSFTKGIASDHKDAAITKALLAMAHWLQLTVVAEGVENEAQMSFLGEHQCDEVQGYLFGKPIPAVELDRVLEEHSIAV